MIESFIVPFIAIALAELGDKTQLCIFMMSSKKAGHLHIFLGAIAAFFIVDGIAIAIGSIAAGLIPAQLVKLAAGAVFIIFGVLALRGSKTEDTCDVRKGGMFFSAFSMILLAELGDKTQVSAGLFAATYNPFIVLLGVMSALAVLTGVAILLGRKLAEKVDRKKISVASGILFILIGISMFFF
jgi:Ca2+/H+ antiporter, TMEM165/GDT1 family